ncbi:MAG TPA: hypothetical protein VMT19_00415 [Thermoanaerobaculaceae bacterium]|nr:hypothetical protein [Thermoanaerobaculaceae bacterium]
MGTPSGSATRGERRFAALALAVAGALTPAVAGGGAGATPRGDTARSRQPGPGPAPVPLARVPQVIGDLEGALQRALRSGYALAARRLHETPRCAALFRSLGADGVAELARSRYRSAWSELCMHGVAALTPVGQPTVQLCPGFGALDPRRAARTLIHEALHAAGLRERPPDPTAPSAEEINRLVEQGCDL